MEWEAPLILDFNFFLLFEKLKAETESDVGSTYEMSQNKTGCTPLHNEPLSDTYPDCILNIKILYTAQSSSNSKIDVL